MKLYKEAAVAVGYLTIRDFMANTYGLNYYHKMASGVLLVA